jgi:hypothetical protein
MWRKIVSEFQLSYCGIHLRGWRACQLALLESWTYIQTWLSGWRCNKKKDLKYLLRVDVVGGHRCQYVGVNPTTVTKRILVAQFPL